MLTRPPFRAPRPVGLGLFALLALSACTHATPRIPSSTDAADYSQDVGSALRVVASRPIEVVPVAFSSLDPRQAFDDAHPLVLNPGDAFVLRAANGNLLTLEFGYDEIVSGTVDVHSFPEGSLAVVPRSDNVEDEAALGNVGEVAAMEDALYVPRKKSGHGHGSDCALTPHKAGCCLAAVKYWLRDNHYVRSDLSNFPGVYGQQATANLPSSFSSVGCGAYSRPVRAMVCSYSSDFNPGEGHVEVYDGSGWYYGLGHQSLHSDGHHVCIDCKEPR